MNDGIEQAAATETDGWEWAIVEIYGHRKHAGRVREEERFGSKMLRIDIPTIPPPRTLLDAADGKPETPPIVWTTHYYGGASIFWFTLTDEESVMRANKPYEAAAASRYRLLPPEPPEQSDPHDEEEPF
jgi:hypothetical protein